MTEPAPAGHDIHGPMLRETDRDARFRAIYDREFPFVWSAARHFGIPPAARDDVVQDVFLTAYRRLDQIYYQVSERAWLYGVTRRVASHYHRSAARRSRRIAALGDLTGTAGEAPHERHDAARLLERLLVRLPRGEREVWELTELLGMSGPEIAGELELPLNTVYSRLRLARAKLLELAAGPDQVNTGIAAIRRREAPSPRESQRTWAAMVPLLSPGKFAAVTAAWTTARAGVMTTLIVGGAAAVVVAAPARRPPDRAAAPAPHLSRETSSPDGAGPTPAAAVVASPSRVAAPPPVDEATRAGDPILSRGTPLRQPRRAPAGTSADALAAEVALLDRARASLDARDAAGAARHLDAHAREFPRGVLVDAREAAAVELLCLQGRRDEATAAAERLAARLPDSVLARRYQRYVCADR